MFREMRRKRQLMDETACSEILERGTLGTLAVLGDDGYPYAVPLNYYYEDGKIYVHGAKSGHKIDAIRQCSKVSFSVVDLEQNVPEEFTTYFRSVVAFGTAALIEDENEKRDAITKIADKFSPDESAEARDAAIQKEWTPLAIIRIDIQHMTGKQAIELVK